MHISRLIRGFLSHDFRTYTGLFYATEISIKRQELLIFIYNFYKQNVRRRFSLFFMKKVRQDNVKPKRNVLLNETSSAEKGLNAFAKSFDSYQPAQSAQADMGRYFSLSFSFLHAKGPL